jgi:DnaJ-class molecular chaperone
MRTKKGEVKCPSCYGLGYHVLIIDGGCAKPRCEKCKGKGTVLPLPAPKEVKR